MNKYSRQREIILKTLNENRIHPTAETVYEIIKKNLPNISLATVYRNLNLLSEKGIIKRLEGVDGIFRFDACIDEHHHFVCTKCGNIYDIEGSSFPDIKESISNKTEYTVDTCDITLKGTCLNCAVKN